MNQRSVTANVFLVALVASCILGQANLPAWAQGDGTPSTAAAAERFAIHSVFLGAGYEAFLIDRASGQVWQQIGEKFKKLSDNPPLPSGNYTLRLIGSPDNKYYALHRLDLQTGRAWDFRSGQWLEVKAEQ